MNSRRAAPLHFVLVTTLFACGPTNGPTDARSDVPPSETGHDVATDLGGDTVVTDAMATDVASDMSLVDAGADTVRADEGVDAPEDAAEDATPDVVAPDAPADVGPDAPADAGRFVIPASCSSDSECGPDARCDTAINRCVCSASALPCGDSCCPWHYEVNTMIATGGHVPEIGGDAAGNRYVLYKFGSTSVRLATIDASGTVSTQNVASSSGIEDDRDLAVSPDGTLSIAVHTDVGSRDGALTLWQRAPGATSFTTRNLRTTYPTPFAYDAAVAISRASNGDLYATESARYLDGTSGLAFTRYDGAAGTWTELTTTALGSRAVDRSEIFARADGFFLGAADSQPSEFYYDFGRDVALRSAIGGYVGSPTGRGDTAAAMDDSGRLFVFTRLSLDTSDHSVLESVNIPLALGGQWSDADMAIDRDGNPAILFHSVTNHVIALMVHMPHGGWTQTTMYESFFLPSGTTSNWMSLDLERLPSGNLAFAIGDSMDRGTFAYREIAR